MKKIISVLSILLVGMCAFSQENVEAKKSAKKIELSLGVKAGALLNPGTKTLVDTPESVNELLKVGGLVGVYGRIPFVTLGPGKMGVQVEADYLMNGGVKSDFSSRFYNGKVEILTNSLDISAFLTYDIAIPKVNGFYIMPYVGAVGTFPMFISSNIQIKDEIGSVSKDQRTYGFATPSVGAAGGLTFKYALGLGSILLDVRYIYDFLPTTGKVSEKNIDLFQRSLVLISAGYEITF